MATAKSNPYVPVPELPAVLYTVRWFETTGNIYAVEVLGRRPDVSEEYIWCRLPKGTVIEDEVPGPFIVHCDTDGGADTFTTPVAALVSARQTVASKHGSVGTKLAKLRDEFEELTNLLHSPLTVKCAGTTNLPAVGSKVWADLRTSVVRAEVLDVTTEFMAHNSSTPTTSIRIRYRAAPEGELRKIRVTPGSVFPSKKALLAYAVSAASEQRKRIDGDYEQALICHQASREDSLRANSASLKSLRARVRSAGRIPVATNATATKEPST